VCDKEALKNDTEAAGCKGHHKGLKARSTHHSRSRDQVKVCYYKSCARYKWKLVERFYLAESKMRGLVSPNFIAQAGRSKHQQRESTAPSRK
jgi:hypothetical protein